MKTKIVAISGSTKWTLGQQNETMLGLPSVESDDAKFK